MTNRWPKEVSPESIGDQPLPPTHTSQALLPSRPAPLSSPCGSVVVFLTVLPFSVFALTLLFACLSCFYPLDKQQSGPVWSNTVLVSVIKFTSCKTPSVLPEVLPPMGPPHLGQVLLLQLVAD